MREVQMGKKKKKRNAVSSCCIIQRTSYESRILNSTFYFSTRNAIFQFLFLRIQLQISLPGPHCNSPTAPLVFQELIFSLQYGILLQPNKWAHCPSHTTCSFTAFHSGKIRILVLTFSPANQVTLEKSLHFHNFSLQSFKRLCPRYFYTHLKLLSYPKTF